FGLGYGMTIPAIEKGARALLAQEINSARGGHYTFRVQASGGGSSAEIFEKIFQAHFTRRLVLFRYPDGNKDPRQVQELFSTEFQPVFAEGQPSKEYSVSRFLGSTIPGANFAIGNGLGVAIVIEKTSPGLLQLNGAGPHRAFVRIDSVSLEFSPRPRDDSV